MKTITTEAAYEAAMERVEILIAQNPEEGSAIFKELDMLGKLLAAYEELHYPI